VHRHEQPVALEAHEPRRERLAGQVERPLFTPFRPRLHDARSPGLLVDDELVPQVVGGLNVTNLGKLAIVLVLDPAPREQVDRLRLDQRLRGNLRRGLGGRLRFVRDGRASREKGDR
jgi:hypothetical protein